MDGKIRKEEGGRGKGERGRRKEEGVRRKEGRPRKEKKISNCTFSNNPVFSLLSPTKFVFICNSRITNMYKKLN